jgi:hypothetical protein
VDTDELMPCYFGRAVRQLINWAVAARKLYLIKGILATMLGINAAYKRCHLNVLAKLQTCTKLLSEGLVLMMLHLHSEALFAYWNGDLLQNLSLT